MSDSYQRGSDVEWALHRKTELEVEVKQASARAGRWRFVAMLLLLLLGWTLLKFLQTQPLEELWNFKSVTLPKF